MALRLVTLSFRILSKVYVRAIVWLGYIYLIFSVDLFRKPVGIQLILDKPSKEATCEQDASLVRAPFQSVLGCQDSR